MTNKLSKSDVVEMKNVLETIGDDPDIEKEIEIFSTQKIDMQKVDLSN